MSRDMRRGAPNDIRSNLATPFVPPQGYFANATSSLSLEAAEDADTGFRPFPDRGTFPTSYPRSIPNVPRQSSPPHFDPPEPQPVPVQVPQHNSARSSLTMTESEGLLEEKQGLHPNARDATPKPIPRSAMTLRGNLILDSEVPTALIQSYGLKGRIPNEFNFMRYMLVTCDPEDFARKQYLLRQNSYSRPRETELLICITLYDEEPYLVARTLKGVIQNVLHLSNRKEDPTWGSNLFKKVLVCFVADGRNKVNPKTLAFFAAMGVYQEGFAKSKFGEEDVHAHIYEHTTHIMPKRTEDGDLSFQRCDVPIQLLLCLKEKNKKKINSHRWCFQAFCEVLKPRVVVLLDAGTQPGRDLIYHLWKAFDRNEQVGGCCGEIKAALGENFRNLLNPLVASQNFEYKILNILDKPTESVFGFVTVLPGAFSAYRYEALLGKPLEEYFRGETLDEDNDATVFKKNMYLAEDRILCFELISKRNCRWLLKYVKSAYAETDTPTQISQLIKQRRRWLNGSFFVSFYSLTHFYRVWQSGHSFWRKLCLTIQFIYQTVQLVVSWFSVASFFLVFRILTFALEDYFGGAKYLAGIFLWMYVASTVITFVLLFGNRPEGASKCYAAMLAFYAVLMIYTMFAAIFITVKAVQDFEKIKSFHSLVFDNSRFRDLVVSTALTYALYFVASFLFFEPWHMFTLFLQYLLVSPTYVNVLNIYAFCNLHDVSWGNREEDTESAGEFKLMTSGKDSDSLELLVDISGVPMDRYAVDDQYAEQMTKLREPNEKAYRTNRCGIRVRNKHIDEETLKKDHYALVRSVVVLFWVGTNCALIAVVLSRDGFTRVSHIESVYQRRSEIFLSVILWIVAFMAAFRFVGCVWYLVGRLREKIRDNRPVRQIGYV